MCVFKEKKYFYKKKMMTFLSKMGIVLGKKKSRKLDLQFHVSFFPLNWLSLKIKLLIMSKEFTINCPYYSYLSKQ